MVQGGRTNWPAKPLERKAVIDRTTHAVSCSIRSTLGPLRFAGIILQGGIVAYDSNVVTGGAGVRFLGIGPSTEHRWGLATVALRAVSGDSGEVLASATSTKSWKSMRAIPSTS